MASLAEIKKRIEQIEAARAKRKKVDITLDGNVITVHGKSDIIYRPSKTGILLSNAKDFVIATKGPVRSGKSTMKINKMMEHTLQMPPCLDGVRRACWAVIRNTYGELETTVLRTWMMWFGDLGDAYLRMNAPIYYKSCFRDTHGPVELEVYFMALDRAEDVKKLDSLELTGAYVNECRYIPEIVIDRLQQRVGQFPKKDFVRGGKFDGLILLDTNPPSTRHWFYEKFEKKKTPGYLLLSQPPGLLKLDDGTYVTNPEADNLENLNPSNYYEQAAIGQSQEHINVMLMGNYGITSEGKPVYHEYDDDRHSAWGLEYMPDLPVYLGIDYQTLPSVVFSQVSPNGQIQFLKELIATHQGWNAFVDVHLMPYIQRTLRGHKIYAYDDPSGGNKVATTATSCRQYLATHGIRAMPAYSNTISVRIEVVRNVLRNNIDGKTPEFILSREGCPTLREGFITGYRFKEVGTKNGTEYKDEPEKDRFADVHDGCQYNLMGIKGPPRPKTVIKTNMKPKGVWA